MTSTAAKNQSKKFQSQFKGLWSKISNSKNRLKVIIGLGLTLVILIGLGTALFLNQQTQENRSSASVAGTPPSLNMLLVNVGGPSSGDRDLVTAGLQLGAGDEGVIYLDLMSGSLPVVAAEVSVYYNTSELEVMPDISQAQRNEFGRISEFITQSGANGGQTIRFLLARSPSQGALPANQKAIFASLKVRMIKPAGDITFTKAIMTTNKVGEPLVTLDNLASGNPFATGLAMQVRQYVSPTAPQPSVTAPQPSVTTEKPNAPVFMNIVADRCYKDYVSWSNEFALQLNDANAQQFTSYDAWVRIIKGQGNPDSTAADSDKLYTADWGCNRNVWNISGIANENDRLNEFNKLISLRSLKWQAGAGGDNCTGVSPNLTTGDYTLRALVAGWKDGQFRQSDPTSVHFQIDNTEPMFVSPPIYMKSCENEQVASIELRWEEVEDQGCADSITYRVEVASDINFNNIIKSQDLLDARVYTYNRTQNENFDRLYSRVIASDSVGNITKSLVDTISCIPVPDY